MKANIDKIHDKLYISDAISKEDFKKILKLGITSIVNLTETWEYKPPKSVKYLHLGFPDGEAIPFNILRRIYHFIEEESKNGKVLVHCRAGLSRSGGVVVGRMMIENQDWSWKQASEFVDKHHPIFPASLIKKSVLDYIIHIRKKV